MSKVFFPIRYEDVPAGAPHGGKPAYRVAYGMEHWADGTPPTPVYKVQMVYDGVVAGRKSPSFPEDSDDLERVIEAMRRVKTGGGRSGRGMAQPVGEEQGLSLREARDLMAST